MGSLIDSPSLSPSAVESVRCVFKTDVCTARREIQESINDPSGKQQIATVVLERMPTSNGVIEECVQALAEAALRLWPNWYDGALTLENRDAESEHKPNRDFMQFALEPKRGVLNAWLTAASRACRDGQTPALRQFSPVVQAQQLGLAVSSQASWLAVFVEEPEPTPARLLGFSRAVEWLAREAQVRIVVVLPLECAARRELDSINFAAVWEDLREPAEEVPGDYLEELADDLEEQKDASRPVVGRPHPASPGECLLAERLARDGRLATLFCFNDWVTTSCGSTHLVDLHWRDGRVVVEVDGYRYHSARPVFDSDRQRDFELTVSGYVVLRLPHDLVMQNTTAAMERIRQVVAFRKHSYLESEGY